MRFLFFLLIGAVMGWLANKQLGAKARQKYDIAAGMVGALCGGSLSLFVKPVDQYVGLASGDVAIAVGGAAIGVFIERVIRTKRVDGTH